jgi:hypothetical protein
MTEKTYGIDADTKAQIQVLVQGRIEDRETIHELAGDMKEMAGNVSTMAIAITEQTKDNHYLNQRVDRIEGVQDKQSEELKTVQNTQEGNKVRWFLLGASILGFISVSAVVITIMLWAFDRYLGV